MATDGDTPAKRTLVKRATLSYPSHSFNPIDLLDFIELPVFTRRWKALDLDVDDDLLALQTMIMIDPRAAPVISGTKGLRKLRFAPSRWGTGKSGAARCLYVYFEEFGIVLLCLVYGKSEVDTISNQAKKAINDLIIETEDELARRRSV